MKEKWRKRSGRGRAQRGGGWGELVRMKKKRIVKVKRFKKKKKKNTGYYSRGREHSSQHQHVSSQL